MDRARPSIPMSNSLLTGTNVPEPALGPGLHFLVGQDAQGRWVAIETHGLAGGLFRSRRDAIDYAAAETRGRPDAVGLSLERIDFRI